MGRTLRPTEPDRQTITPRWGLGFLDLEAINITLVRSWGGTLFALTRCQRPAGLPHAAGTASGLGCKRRKLTLPFPEPGRDAFQPRPWSSERREETGDGGGTRPYQVQGPNARLQNVEPPHESGSLAASNHLEWLTQVATMSRFSRGVVHRLPACAGRTGKMPVPRRSSRVEEQCQSTPGSHHVPTAPEFRGRENSAHASRHLGAVEAHGVGRRGVQHLHDLAGAA